MAIGLLGEGQEEGETSIFLQGHLFPLPLPQVGSKRRAEESPYVNALDIGPFKHIYGEAIIEENDLDWFTATGCFPDDFDTAPAAPAASFNSQALQPNDLEFASAMLSASNSLPFKAAESAPASKRAKVSSGSTECSRTSSANTTVASFLAADSYQTVESASASSPEKLPEHATNSANVEAAANAEAAAEAAAKALADTRRGENVRKNPQMQKTARDGQKHWHDKVQEMRIQYDMAHTGMVHPQFAEQRFMCTVRNLKCQKESLLIFLQFAMQQRLIWPLAFVHPSDETLGFLGWTGFQINRGCGPRFRAGVEALFPEKPKLNTLYHLFRRSGLVPEDWRRAWDGELPFLWNPARAS